MNFTWNLTLSQSTVFFLWTYLIQKTRTELKLEKELFAVLLHDSSVLCLGSLLPHSPPLLFLSLLYVILHTHLQLSTYKHFFLLYRLGSAHEELSALFLSLSGLCIIFYILSSFLLLQTSWSQFVFRTSYLFSMWVIFSFIYWWTPRFHFFVIINRKGLWYYP